MKKLLWSIVGVLIIAAAAAIFLSKNRENNGKSFKTEPVVRGDIVSTVIASGTVNAVTTVLVGTQVSGSIKHIYVDFNSRVRRGQVIAEIDPATFEAQVDQARANVLSAHASLEKAAAALLDAKRTMERNQGLYSRNMIAESELDASETNHESAKAQMSAARAQIAQAEASLKIAETSLRYTRIVSPVDGIVVSRNVDVGQTVAASFQTPTLFTIAQDLTKMQINASVAEADIGKIVEGQQVEFTVDAYPDMTFNGRVSEVRNAPIIAQNVVTYDVVVKVDNRGLKLKPGMTANVSIITSEKKGIIKIPNAALRFRPSDMQNRDAARERGTGVWIIEEEKPKRIKVTAGISDGSYSEMVSGDLKEGQELIVESLTKPKGQSAQSGPRMF